MENKLAFRFTLPRNLLNHCLENDLQGNITLKNPKVFTCTVPVLTARELKRNGVYPKKHSDNLTLNLGQFAYVPDPSGDTGALRYRHFSTLSSPFTRYGGNKANTFSLVMTVYCSELAEGNTCSFDTLRKLGRTTGSETGTVEVFEIIDSGPSDIPSTTEPTYPPIFG